MVAFNGYQAFQGGGGFKAPFNPQLYNPFHAAATKPVAPPVQPYYNQASFPPGTYNPFQATAAKPVTPAAQPYPTQASVPTQPYIPLQAMATKPVAPPAQSYPTQARVYPSGFQLHELKFAVASDEFQTIIYITFPEGPFAVAFASFALKSGSPWQWKVNLNTVSIGIQKHHLRSHRMDPGNDGLVLVFRDLSTALSFKAACEIWQATYAIGLPGGTLTIKPKWYGSELKSVLLPSTANPTPVAGNIPR